MKVILRQGDTLRVELEDTDGKFDISYGKEIPGHLTIHADMEDTSGRRGTIYDEDYSQPPGPQP